MEIAVGGGWEQLKKGHHAAPIELAVCDQLELNHLGERWATADGDGCDHLQCGHRGVRAVTERKRPSKQAAVIIIIIITIIIVIISII
eukprot:1205988-Karenia_brevis.AAC.1